MPAASLLAHADRLRELSLGGVAIGGEAEAAARRGSLREFARSLLEPAAANPVAALGFHWKSLRRQVRVRGTVAPVAAEEADAYFASRARDSRIGAWASKQSRPLESRFALEKAVAREAARFGLGEVPRPPHWSGFRITPLAIEFWRDRPFRLHDRMTFSRPDSHSPWRVDRLYP